MKGKPPVESYEVQICKEGDECTNYSYKVGYDWGSGWREKTVSDPDNRTVTFSDLERETTYRLRARAISHEGASFWSLSGLAFTGC